MNHTLFDIKPFKKMEDDVHDGDIVSIYFDHTKLTGHIQSVTPWTTHSKDHIDKDDNYTLSLHNSEGSSENLQLNFLQYGINSEKGTISNRHWLTDKMRTIPAIGYSIVKRQWDYQIDGFIPGKVHCGFGLGTYPINGETDKDKYKIKGVLLNNRKNFGPSAGILMYADPKGKYVDKVLMLLSEKNEQMLARKYNAIEVYLTDSKLYLKAKESDQNIEQEKSATKNTIHMEKRLPFSEKSLEKIINKKVNTILDTTTHVVNIVQL